LELLRENLFDQFSKSQKSSLEDILLLMILSPNLQALNKRRNPFQGIDSAIGSSDLDIFLEIQYASCVFGLALKSQDYFIKKRFWKC
jgi:hypothetical protein